MRCTWLVDSSERIDKLYTVFGFPSRSVFAKSIDNGLITINGKPVQRNYKLSAGDSIEVMEYIAEEILPKPLPIQVIYEDEYILVVNKPPQTAVHPAKSYTGDTVIHWLLYYGCSLSDGENSLRPGIVHRLDADTTGCLLIAKNNLVHQKFKTMFQNRDIRKDYLAIVHGRVKSEELVIDAPIGRGKNPIKMGVTEKGRKAISHVRVIRANEEFSYLKVNIETGRTHQIRVHLSHIGHPILGDKLYGKKKERISVDRQMLHASSLRFIHPIIKRELYVEAPLPKDFIKAKEKTFL